MIEILHIPSARRVKWSSEHDFKTEDTILRVRELCDTYDIYIVFEDDKCYFLPENMIILYPEKFPDTRKVIFEHLEFIEGEDADFTYR